MNELLHLNFSNSSNWKFHLLKSKNCAKLFGISQSFFEQEKNFALQYVLNSSTKLLDWFPLFILDSSSRRRKISSQSKEVPTTREKKMWRLFFQRQMTIILKIDFFYFSHDGYQLIDLKSFKL